jgi:hypothetical protein
MSEAIIIRRSTAEDRPAIAELAALDSRRPPQAEALLAFIGTELRAALPLNGGEAIADPFHHTAELVELLRIRAPQPPQRRDRRARRPAGLRPRTA